MNVRGKLNRVWHKRQINEKTEQEENKNKKITRRKE